MTRQWRNRIKKIYVFYVGPMTLLKNKTNIKSQRYMNYRIFFNKTVCNFRGTSQFQLV